MLLQLTLVLNDITDLATTDDLPEGGRGAKGRSLANVIMKSPDETVTAFQTIKDFDQEDTYVVMCTKHGTIKKTALSDFANIRQNGIIAIGLKDGDQMIEAERLKTYRKISDYN